MGKKNRIKRQKQEQAASEMDFSNLTPQQIVSKLLEINKEQARLEQEIKQAEQRRDKEISKHMASLDKRAMTGDVSSFRLEDLFDEEQLEQLMHIFSTATSREGLQRTLLDYFEPLSAQLKAKGFNGRYLAYFLPLHLERWRSTPLN